MRRVQARSLTSESLASAVSDLLASAVYEFNPASLAEVAKQLESKLRGDQALAPPEGSWLDTKKPDFSFGEFTITYKGGQLFRGTRPVNLSQQEFRLLCLLSEHPGEIMGTDRLLNEAWHYEASLSTHTVYVHIAWLRKKLRSQDRPDGHIKTIRGLGYIFQL